MTVAFRHPDADRVRETWRARLALAYAYAGLVVMWGVWTCLVVFLCEPRGMLSWWPFPTVDGVGRETPAAVALMIDVGLIALFGLQHSLMARPWFKQRLHAMPAPLQRVTYVHAANAALFLVVIGWQPLPTLIWHVTWKPLEVAVWALFALGWLTLLAGAMSFGIRDLLGVTTVETWIWRGHAPAEKLKTGWLYRWLEHPMYVGVLTAFWATPRMSVGHFLLASGMTAYVLIALRYEKRDLKARFGQPYEAWRA